MPTYIQAMLEDLISRKNSIVEKVESMKLEEADSKSALNILGISKDATYEENARVLKPYFQKGAQTLPDEEALIVKGIYPTWKELLELGSVDTNGETGYKFTKDGDLYKCVNPNPTFQEDWVPGINTFALYVRIDETNEGTLENPKVAARGMAYEKDKYYLDPEDSKVYLCTRAGELAYLPHELIGHYFELAV